MMEPFLGEIRLMGFAYDTQDGWLLCDGRILLIQKYQALYALIGTQFGGDGKTNFNLPDLRGRVGVNLNATGTYKVGATGGAETVALATDLHDMPAHTHAFMGTSENADKPAVGAGANRLLGVTTATLYGAAAKMVAMNDATSSYGSSKVHNNMQPSLVVAYCIASQGLWPSRP